MQSSGITMNASITATASWITLYQVTFAVSGGGLASPTGSIVWENAGSLSITATPNTGYTFSSWSSNTGSITFNNANSVSATATINGTGTITGNFLVVTPTSTPSAQPLSPVSTPIPTPTPASAPTTTPIPTLKPSPTPTVPELTPIIVLLTLAIATCSAILVKVVKQKNLEILSLSSPLRWKVASTLAFFNSLAVLLVMVDLTRAQSILAIFCDLYKNKWVST